MKTKLFHTIFLMTIFVNTYSQNEHCGSMKNLQMMLEKDSTLKQKLIVYESEIQEYIKKRGIGLSGYDPYKETSDNGANKTQNTTSLCGYNNTSFTVITAPTVKNQKVSPSPNCTYGGEYVRVNGLLAGHTYRVSLCGLNNFDTQLTIYTQGGGQAVAHNDDWCGSQSEVYFTPMTTGNYDVLVDAFNCTSNTLCAKMEVELWNIPRAKITIPVVVHVVHFGEPIGTGRNLSVSQINSQINVLNTDFRRLNPDINSIPAAFRGSSIDPLIEFCLATQDELGNPTTGITRHLGSQASWNINDCNVSVKPQTIWDRDKYLNLWTVEFASPDAGTLGFAQFPNTGAANTDGVVIRYNAFGNIGNVVAPFDLGRTATHEVGHWLNLRHIWGDENACAADDLVSDTPIQGVSSNGVPTFPKTDACTVNYPGIMFYNYMDYSDDAVTSMFTYGQFVRIDAAIQGARSSLMSSPGCEASTVGIKENYSNNNISVYPNPSEGVFNIKFNSIISQKYNVSVVNAIGEKIFEIKSNGENIIVDLSQYSSGIYYIRVNSVENMSNLKIIVTNN